MDDDQTDLSILINAYNHTSCKEGPSWDKPGLLHPTHELTGILKMHLPTGWNHKSPLLCNFMNDFTV